MTNMIFKTKTIWLLCAYLICSHMVIAQSFANLTLDSCHILAIRNFPLIKQHELIERTAEYSIANARKANLPQLSISVQSTYQSDVTQIPFSVPGFDIPVMDKSQYRLYSEVSQSITDLFIVKDQANLIKTNSEIEAQKIEVELYKLRERINNLYFGILLIDAQIEQAFLLKSDIQRGIDKTNVAISNGIALKSTADNLKAELLNVDQRNIELKAARKGFADMLSVFTGQQIDEKTVLAKPVRLVLTHTVNRPELRLFDLQKKSFDAQNKLVANKNLPRVNLFLQGGVGRPGLNMLDNDMRGYFIGGLRLNWSLTNFYSFSNEKKILSLNQDAVEVQRETFLFNTNLSSRQQNAEISKMLELIETDKNIISLRESVKNTTQNQLQFGTATTNDYLTAVNAEDQAKQNLILHEIQLLMTEYALRVTLGN